MIILKRKNPNKLILPLRMLMTPPFLLTLELMHIWQINDATLPISHKGTTFLNYEKKKLGIKKCLGCGIIEKEFIIYKQFDKW